MAPRRHAVAVLMRFGSRSTQPWHPPDASNAVLSVQEPIGCSRFIWFMKPTPSISEKKAAIVIWIGAAIFTIGAMIFGR